MFHSSKLQLTHLTELEKLSRYMHLKGSAPWAVDVARYARARKISTKCEGVRKNRPKT